MQDAWGGRSGGVVALLLNPRLMAVNPPGSGMVVFGGLGEIHLVVYVHGHPRGVPAISQGVSEAGATPSEFH